ncbi:uncharacterized protein G2W53_030667 [Senna tora]|uniref:Uncharacterized protein n=1 Tax=Senna tora TaxID=362788 RepID=A0A834T6G1_9FABA|nr:uncharacterized protein G2W53_030667 [Senna tora]
MAAAQAQGQRRHKEKMWRAVLSREFQISPSHPRVSLAKPKKAS